MRSGGYRAWIRRQRRARGRGKGDGEGLTPGMPWCGEEVRPEKLEAAARFGRGRPRRLAAV